MQGGDSASGSKLSRRQKKGGTYVIIALVLGFLAWSSYQGGNTQLAQGLGLLAFLAFVFGVLD